MSKADNMYSTAIQSLDNRDAVDLFSVSIGSEATGEVVGRSAGAWLYAKSIALQNLYRQSKMLYTVCQAFSRGGQSLNLCCRVW